MILRRIAHGRAVLGHADAALPAQRATLSAATCV